MDYLEWELERQKAALNALMLGKGTVEDEDAVRKDGRQALRENAARYSQKTREPDPNALRREEIRNLRDEIRRTWQILPDASFGPGPAGPLTAWEEISGGEVPAFEGSSGSKTPVMGASDPGRERAFSGDETGAYLPSGGSPGETEALSNLWAVSAGRQARVLASGSALTPPDGETSASSSFERTQPSALRSERFFSDQYNAAARRNARPQSFRRSGGGIIEASGQTRNTVGSVAGALQQNGEAVSRQAEDGGTPGPHGGGWSLSSLRAADGAKEFSRAVQQDARRYDGGFLIYN